MTSFLSKENSYNKQMALTYIAYMMGGSYFRSCHCSNPLEEKHLYMHYSQMPREKQFRLESNFLHQLDKLDSSYLSRIAELKCTAYFRHHNDIYEIIFSTGGFESLRCRIDEFGHISCLD